MKIAVIGHVWPEPKSSAAGVRMLELLDSFQGAGWKSEFLSACAANDHSVALAQRGTPAHSIQLNHSSFDEFIKELAPDLVLFDRFMTEEQFGSRVRNTLPDCLRVIDTVDLHFLRRDRERMLKQGKPLERIFDGPFSRDSDEAVREISAIYRSDLSLVLSDFEVALLKDHFHVPSELIFHSPFHCEAAGVSPVRADRNHFAFIGNFRHAPNADAVRWLHQEIWPLIRKKLPAVELHVYGAYPPKEMMALTNEKMGFIVKGEASDVNLCLSQYRVGLMPLRFGAGLKGKITESWKAGTPVVTTPVGAEGMHGNAPFGGRVERSAQALAAAAVELFTNERSWEEARERGNTLLVTFFDRPLHERRLLDALRDTVSNRDARRDRNFTGRMLWHHQYRSTEYFSRWVELKNAL